MFLSGQVAAKARSGWARRFASAVAEARRLLCGFGRVARHETRSVRCAHFAQTAAASQVTKRAARAAPCPALLVASHEAPRPARMRLCRHSGAPLCSLAPLGRGSQLESSSDAQSQRSEDRHSMSPRRVPPAATRRNCMWMRHLSSLAPRKRSQTAHTTRKNVVGRQGAQLLAPQRSIGRKQARRVSQANAVECVADRACIREVRLLAAQAHVAREGGLGGFVETVVQRAQHQLCDLHEFGFAVVGKVDGMRKA